MGFGERKAAQGKEKKRGATFHESAVTILTPGCHFDGKLYCRGSSRIGGKIEGEIISEGLLIIEEEAQIIAKIKADEAVLQGEVKGRLEAAARVTLTATCKFEGDIVTPSLIVQEGAQFNGFTSMQPTPTAEQEISTGPVVEKINKKTFKDKEIKELGWKDKEGDWKDKAIKDKEFKASNIKLPDINVKI